MTLYEKFLRQAKEQIALQNLTQAEVGRAIGLSRNAISKALNGKVVLKGDKLLDLAQLLKIDLGFQILDPTTMTLTGEPSMNWTPTQIAALFKAIEDKTLLDKTRTMEGER